MQARFRKTKRQDRFDFLSANVVFGCRYEIAFVAIFSCGHATLKDASSVRQLVSWLVGPSHSSWKVGKRAFPPLPNRPQLVAVYPALFFIIFSRALCDSISHVLVHWSIGSSVRPSICPSAHPSVCPSILPSVHPSIYPSICPAICPCIRPSVRNVRNVRNVRSSQSPLKGVKNVKEVLKTFQKI